MGRTWATSGLGLHLLIAVGALVLAGIVPLRHAG
jgi:hypothetical protein